ncbi:hypothetical protein [Nesterenkonia sp.]|uniref:hypothetical protein n=1 Tax=Nesterenkonia sp. TaxID=704201 RepID=UPI002629D535|nr:hypothetical protein [Nesterenkonia sp.]
MSKEVYENSGNVAIEYHDGTGEVTITFTQGTPPTIWHTLMLRADQWDHSTEGETS